MTILKFFNSQIESSDYRLRMIHFEAIRILIQSVSDQLIPSSLIYLEFWIQRVRKINRKKAEMKRPNLIGWLTISTTLASRFTHDDYRVSTGTTTLKNKDTSNCAEITQKQAFDLKLYLTNKKSIWPIMILRGFKGFGKTS